jgi:putative spermidine/putrescine transport system permease protein
MQDFPNVLYSGWGLGMVLAYTLKGTPFAMLLILALLVRFDVRQIQTAAMLGASGVRIFFFIVLPRLAPGPAHQFHHLVSCTASGHLTSPTS